MNPYAVSKYLRELAVEPAQAPEDLTWQDKALCAEVGGDMFFPDKGEPSLPAKRVCRGCEVRAECLDYAMEHEIRFGVWGGFSERERRQLRRQQASSVTRPREADAA